MFNRDITEQDLECAHQEELKAAQDPTAPNHERSRAARAVRAIRRTKRIVAGILKPKTEQTKR